MGFYRSITKVIFKRGDENHEFNTRKDAIAFYDGLNDNKVEWKVEVFVDDFCTLDMSQTKSSHEVGWRIFERLKRSSWDDFDTTFRFEERKRGLIILTKVGEFVDEFERRFGPAVVLNKPSDDEVNTTVYKNINMVISAFPKNHSVEADFVITKGTEWSVHMRNYRVPFVYATLEEVMANIDWYDRGDSIYD